MTLLCGDRFRLITALAGWLVGWLAAAATYICAYLQRLWGALSLVQGASQVLAVEGLLGCPRASCLHPAFNWWLWVKPSELLTHCTLLLPRF